MSWWWCCCSEDCECECENCSDTATCCWKVVISGMVGGDCDDCGDLNTTHYLAQDGENPCLWRCTKNYSCDPMNMTLEVVLESGEYIIRVTLGSHVWEKNYGASKPACCNVTSEELTHVTSSGDCDSSNATCIISSTELGTEECPCAGEQQCCQGDVPDCLKVTLAGFSGTCDGGTNHGPTTSCACFAMAAILTS